ncbi:MAG: hypothetical protein WA134_12425 [Rhodoferax sp.]|uniref:hypothetical protein n=1 Tax=Rhodoferax sp. TaxID=50421 RepID=UPI003BB5B1E3
MQTTLLKFAALALAISTQATPRRHGRSASASRGDELNIESRPENFSRAVRGIARHG